MGKRVAAIFAGLIIMVGRAQRAWADASPADQAAADVLFNEALKLENQGKLDEACPKFVESQRLDPTPGTLLNIGDCYEKAGKTASSYGAFVEAEAAARNAGDKLRQKEAARRMKVLEPVLSMLAISVAAGRAVDGLEVKRDGRAVGKDLWGTGIPVDPGEHRLEATAPGRKAWASVVQIEAAKPGTTTITVPELTPLPVAPPPSSPPPTTGGGGWSTQRTVGLVVGGVGVVGMVIGSVFGVRAITKNAESKKHCGADPNVCDPTGVSLRGEVKTAGTVSTAAFVAGGVALAGGVVLFLTAPGNGKRSVAKRWEAGPAVVGSGAGVVVAGRW